MSEDLLSVLFAEVRSSASSSLLSPSSSAGPLAGRRDNTEFSSARRPVSDSTETRGSPRENPAQATGSVIQAGIADDVPFGNSHWRYSPSERETRRLH